LLGHWEKRRNLSSHFAQDIFQCVVQLVEFYVHCHLAKKAEDEDVQVETKDS